MWKQTREGQVVRTNERGPHFVKKYRKKERAALCERKRGPDCLNKRERARLREQKREREPSCVNKRRRARLCEQKREGQVMPTPERGPGCGKKKKEDRVVGIIKRGPRCGNKRERATLWNN